jgi:phospholipase/carboxylesterase
MDEPRDQAVGNWTLKVRAPNGDGPHPVIFLIHGWTGDEKSMWVFSSRMPRNAILIAPRAPYVSRHPEFGGYSWVQDRGQSFSNLDMFQPAVESFEELLTQLPKALPGEYNRFGIVGFSQGAAFSYAFALRNPHRINRLASLAGFLPSEANEIAPLASIPIFIAHGTEDETVPVSMSRSARSSLEAADVKVSYCESETGHKLGANCAKQLEEFFQSVS